MKTAMILSIQAVGTSAVPTTKVYGNTLIAASAIPMHARLVKEGGPTLMNIPGRVFGEGSPSVIRRRMY